MEASITCYARGTFLPNASSQSSTALASPPSNVRSFTSRSLKSSSIFGESLRTVSKSSLKVSKTKNSPLVTKCEIGDSLEEFLTKATQDKGLIRVMMCMGEAIRTIAFKVRTASCGGTACINTFGDEQLAVDMLADKLLFEALTYSHFCNIVDTNFTVGTIFGVWPGDKLTGVTGRDQVAAAMGIYGPRTTYVIALKDIPGTHEFLLLDEGKWQHVKDTTEIGEGKMFSPGNLRATFDNPDYAKIIVKEKGVFTNVISPTTKAKLRLLFEVAPLGFLIEKAGGYSSDGKQSVLDKVIQVLDERTEVAYGSKNEIIRFEETLYGSSRLKAGEPVGAAV
ncbi:Sedoheptulose-1,7-bisphosphatase protein [Thalictrum thalictroides]|uniref:Sedoheptulose-1,7-bisphosphatase protein n=1 Tax=Thalictrum thalictroides TaxID=46969 RepID=A0A7J6WBY3_THATH|nr:Sedoheptulose-1,7-bisphosphatase protein [Thalictrum thalictroides]